MWIKQCTLAAQINIFLEEEEEEEGIGKEEELESLRP